MTKKTDKTPISKAPASTQNTVLAKEIRNLTIKPVKYMKPIVLTQRAIPKEDNLIPPLVESQPGDRTET